MFFLGNQHLEVHESSFIPQETTSHEDHGEQSCAQRRPLWCLSFLNLPWPKFLDFFRVLLCGALNIPSKTWVLFLRQLSHFSYLLNNG